MNTRFAKFLAVFFALLIIVALAAPTLTYAQEGGLLATGRPLSTAH